MATITDEQIKALRREAAVAGDTPQVVMCDAALEGDTYARAYCAAVVAEAAAQNDEVQS